MLHTSFNQYVFVIMLDLTQHTNGKHNNKVAVLITTMIHLNYSTPLTFIWYMINDLVFLNHMCAIILKIIIA